MLDDGIYWQVNNYMFRPLAVHNSEVCHPRCVSKTNSEVNSVRKHNYNCMLDDGIYWQVNNYMFRPTAVHNSEVSSPMCVKD